MKKLAQHLRHSWEFRDFEFKYIVIAMRLINVLLNMRGRKRERGERGEERERERQSVSHTSTCTNHFPEISHSGKRLANYGWGVLEQLTSTKNYN